MPSPDTLSHPPFPELIWTDCDWWEGQVTLPAWAGFQSRGGPYGAMSSSTESNGTAVLNLTPNDPDVSRLPSAAQCRAYEVLREKGDVIVHSVVEALLIYYRGLRPRWEAYFDSNTMAVMMPPVTELVEFRRLIGLSQIHIHSWEKDDLSYVGLEFGCTWDREHGFGVMLHGARVVEIGAAEVSFAWKPEEAGESD